MKSDKFRVLILNIYIYFMVLYLAMVFGMVGCGCRVLVAHGLDLSAVGCQKVGTAHPCSVYWVLLPSGDWWVE